MAYVLDEEGFRLPSEFLPDDLFMENDDIRTVALGPVCMKLSSEFPNKFDSLRSCSVLSSPVESTVSSSETESSDKDFLAALMQRFAQSSLSETKISTSSYFYQNQQERNNLYVSGSPQSTLTGTGKYLYPRTFSGSPDGPFQFPSPPETPFGPEKETRGLSKQDTQTVSQTRSYPSRCIRTLPCLKYPSSRSYSDPRVFQSLPQSSQFQSGRYEQVSKEECSLEFKKMEAFYALQQQKHRFDTRESNIVPENGRCEPHEALVYHPWQTQNQSKQPKQNRSVLPPSVNGGSAVKRESVGTGVFLPRSYANPPEQRNHTGYPIDCRVKVQEFSLSHQETNGRRQGPFYDELVPSYAPKYGISTQQRHDYRADATLKHGLLLPLEWTYSFMKK